VSCSRRVLIHIWTACFMQLKSSNVYSNYMFLINMKSINKIRHTFVYRVFKNKLSKITFWTTNLSQHQTGKQRSHPGMVQRILQPTNLWTVNYFLFVWRWAQLWRSQFGRGYGPVARQTNTWTCAQASQRLRRNTFIIMIWGRNPKMSVFWASLEAENLSELNIRSLRGNYTILLPRFKHRTVIWGQVISIR
jgi:hypothetical protein